MFSMSKFSAMLILQWTLFNNPSGQIWCHLLSVDINLLYCFSLTSSSCFPAYWYTRNGITNYDGLFVTIGNPSLPPDIASNYLRSSQQAIIVNQLRLDDLKITYVAYVATCYNLCWCITGKHEYVTKLQRFARKLLGSFIAVPYLVIFCKICAY